MSETSETGDGKVAKTLITDPKTMRALAHPVRLALLETIRTEGQITATRAAELLDESPGNMSWHLQTLAKYGYIEEVEGAKGRSRPWRLKSVSNTFSAIEDDPSSRAAGEALVTSIADRSHQLIREYWSIEQSLPPEWRQAAFMIDNVTYLTPEEQSELSDQLADFFERFAGRTDKAHSPEGAMPVHFNSVSHRLPPKAGES